MRRTPVMHQPSLQNGVGVNGQAVTPGSTDIASSRSILWNCWSRLVMAYTHSKRKSFI